MARSWQDTLSASSSNSARDSYESCEEEHDSRPGSGASDAPDSGSDGSHAALQPQSADYEHQCTTIIRGPWTSSNIQNHPRVQQFCSDSQVGSDLIVYGIPPFTMKGFIGEMIDVMRRNPGHQDEEQSLRKKLSTMWEDEKFRKDMFSQIEYNEATLHLLVEDPSSEEGFAYKYCAANDHCWVGVKDRSQGTFLYNRTGGPQEMTLLIKGTTKDGRPKFKLSSKQRTGKTTMKLAEIPGLASPTPSSVPRTPTVHGIHLTSGGRVCYHPPEAEDVPEEEA